MANAGRSFTKTYHNHIYPAIEPSQRSLSAAGKVVLITGGGQGIGAAIAEAFLLAEAKVIIITGRTQSTLDKTIQNLEATAKEHSSPTKVASFVNDVSDYQDVERVFVAVREKFGGIDIVVNNAGILGDVVPLATSSPETWWAGFEINVRGGYNVIRNFLPLAKDGAVLLNLSTLLAHIPVNGYSAYGGSKAAFLHVLDVAQKEHPNIRVHNLHPGIIATAMNADGRVVPEDDVELPAAFAVWLASPEASFLAGRMVWANWDVTELKQQRDEIVDRNLLTMSLGGWNTI